jgi:hypothetical protein
MAKEFKNGARVEFRPWGNRSCKRQGCGGNCRWRG